MVQLLCCQLCAIARCVCVAQFVLRVADGTMSERSCKYSALVWHIDVDELDNTDGYCQCCNNNDIDNSNDSITINDNNNASDDIACYFHDEFNRID